MGKKGKKQTAKIEQPEEPKNDVDNEDFKLDF
jgi:hypothetical protein